MKTAKKFLGISLTILGICCILCSVLWYENLGFWTQYEEYGGDAYTGIQNAVADTSNNLQVISKVLFVILGAFFIIIGIYNLIVASNLQEKEEDNVEATSKSETACENNVSQEQPPINISNVANNIQYLCPKCGKHVTQSDNSCKNCGQRLDWT